MTVVVVSLDRAQISDSDGFYRRVATLIDGRNANAFDEVHYEAFGGDLLGSRLLANVAYGW